MKPAQSYRVLVTDADGAHHLSRALTFDRTDLDVEFIEPDAATIPSQSFDESRAVDVFVIGPCLADPLTKADQLRQLAPRAQVVFLVATGRIESFRTSLPFVPHLSDAWTAPVDAPPEATRSVVLEAARTARGRHGLLSVFDRINAQLTVGRASAEVQRRQRQIMLSEKYLATILKQAPDAIFALDLNCVVIATNEAANRLFGLSADDAIGRPALHLFAPDVHEEIGALLERGRTGETIIGYETIIMPAGAAPAHAELRLASIRDDDSQIVGLAVTARDITERKRAEIEHERLVELEETLRQIQKMETLGQLTGGIAHDFKNLLMIIIGNLEIMDESFPRDESVIRRALERARVGADRANALTQRLLAFSRRQSLHAKPVQVDELMSSMAEVWRQALGHANRLEIEAAHNLPPILVDPNQLENALLNLILNARDASEPAANVKIAIGGISVDVPTLTRSGQVAVGNYVSISVEDKGSGISPHDIDKVFEPLFTTKPTGQGTGLGLSMVYGFVKQSGGHIDIESELGRGTAIRLIFPSLREQAET
ncbi:MAG: PAS domain S-box protein [Bradyrhizobium sp.]|nr:PAS domain S-box protein [Bradyrhizobium sp.]